MTLYRVLGLITALALLAGCAGRAEKGPAGGVILPGLPAYQVLVQAQDQRADRSLDPDLASRFQHRVERALSPPRGATAGDRHRLLLTVVEHTAYEEQFQGRRVNYPRWSAKTRLAAQLRGPDGAVLRSWKAAGWAGGVQPERTTRQDISRQSFEQALGRLLKAMRRYRVK